VHAGGERTSETFTSPVALGHAGAEVSYRVLKDLPLRLAGDWRASRQGYLVAGLSSSSRSAFSPEVDEQRVDTSLTAGYDLGPLLLSSGRLAVLPSAGLHYLAVRNGTFPVDLFGPEFGLSSRFAISPALYVTGAVATTFNALKKKGTLSAVGRPFADVAINAGIGLPLAGGHALELQYVGDVLPMTYDTRVAHGASVGVRSAF
jgi:hypothetical protein